MSEIYFLTLQEVLDMHKMLINLYGGMQGVRDRNLLESAILQPQICFGGTYVYEGLCQMAAAYIFHISKNHPFVDGNKRTGIFSAINFLEYNYGQLNVDQDLLFKLSLDVANSKIGKKEIALFFEKHLIKR